MMKKRYRFLTTLACVVLVSLGVSMAARRAIRGAPLAALHPQSTNETSLWTPYQITFKHYVTKAGEKRPFVIADIVQGLRSDGSRAEFSIFYRIDGSIEYRERFIALRGGIRVRSEETLGLMTVTKDPASDRALSRQAFDPTRPCAVAVDGGRLNKDVVVAQDTVSGFATYRYFTDLKLYRRTVWRAPALECAELRTLGEKVDPLSGGVVGASERVATEILQRDPDAALFSLPTGLRNVSPSELAIAHADQCCKAKLKDSELAALQAGDVHFRHFRFDP